MVNFKVTFDPETTHLPYWYLQYFVHKNNNIILLTNSILSYIYLRTGFFA